MPKKNARLHRIMPFDIAWVTAIALGVFTGTAFGTWSWIQEPVTDLGRGYTLGISIVLILIGAFIMGDSGCRRGGLALGRYVDLFCGIMIVTVAGCIALDAPAPFGL